MSSLFKPKGLRIPVLMYHSISDEAETRHPYYWINTTPARFSEHMKVLHDNGYQVISLFKAVEMIKTYTLSGLAGRDWPALRYVVLTFDDGYRDFYMHAFPVLRHYGLTATVFLPTSYVSLEKPGIREKLHLSWEQVRELANQGITFGSHTVTHPQLSHLNQAGILHELRESKRIIGEKIGQPADQPITSFCYPYRFPQQDTGFRMLLSECLSKAGYDICVTTRIGSSNTAKDILCLKRLPVNTADDRSLFLAKLNGCYDWLSALQSLFKTIKRPYESARSYWTR